MDVRPQLTPIGSALAGALGAVFSNAVVYPLDTVKTRLQALPPSRPDTSSADSRLPAVSLDTHHPHSINEVRRLPQHILRRLRKWRMLSLLLQILRTEGIAGAFKGFSANMLNTFSQQFAYFFFHTLLRTRLILFLSRRKPSSSSLSTSSELLLGAAAGALAQIFTIPVQVIATRQQLWLPCPSSEKHTRPPSLFETASEIISESGPTGLWTGLKPGLVLTVNPAITYGVFERVKSAVVMKKGAAKLSVGEAFWIGVGSKTLATVVTYPYIYAKVRLQARSFTDPPIGAASSPNTTSHATDADSAGPSPATFTGNASHPAPADAVVISDGPEAQVGKQARDSSRSKKAVPRGALPLLAAVYREKGFSGWYQGLSAQIVKAVLCQGILFVSKDKFETYAWLILAFLARLRARLVRA